VAHPHIALDIERRGPSEPEGLHVRIHLGLVHSRIRPGAPEAWDELVIHRTAVLIDELYPLVGAIVGITIVDHYVEAVCESQDRY